MVVERKEMCWEEIVVFLWELPLVSPSFCLLLDQVVYVVISSTILEMYGIIRPVGMNE